MKFNITPELIEKAQQARKEKRANGLAMFKVDWRDDQHWQELAKEASNLLGVKISLPQHHIAPSGIKLDRFAEQLGVELGESFFGVGVKNTTNAIKKENLARPEGSKYNARMYYGLILELWKEKQK